MNLFVYVIDCKENAWNSLYQICEVGSSSVGKNTRNTRPEIMRGGRPKKNIQVLYGRSSTRVGTLIVATIYLQLIQNRYMFRSFTVLHCNHQHCLQPVASDVDVVGYL